MRCCCCKDVSYLLLANIIWCVDINDDRLYAVRVAKHVDLDSTFIEFLHRLFVNAMTEVIQYNIRLIAKNFWLNGILFEDGFCIDVIWS